MSMALVMLILRAPPPRCPASRSSTSLFLNFSSPSEVRSCLPPLYRDRSPSWHSSCHFTAKHVTILPLACCWARWGHQLYPLSVRVPILWSGGWGHGPCCVEAGQSCSISSYCSIKHLQVKKINERIKTDRQPTLPLYSFQFDFWFEQIILVLLICSSKGALRHGVHRRLRLLLLPSGGRTRPYLANIGQIHLYLSETMERQVFVIPLRANKYNRPKPQHLLRDLKISFGTSEFHNVGLFLDLDTEFSSTLALND